MKVGRRKILSGLLASPLALLCKPFRKQVSIEQEVSNLFWKEAKEQETRVKYNQYDWWRPYDAATNS